MAEKKIRIAGVPEHFNMPWHIGIEEGHFEGANAAAEFRVFAGGTGAMISALDNDEVDVAVVLSEGCIQALANGVKGKIVKTFVNSPLIWGIHTSANGPIKSIDQMQGATYAISRMGSGSHLMAIVDADLRGWSTDDLQLTTVQHLVGARQALAAQTAEIFLWEKYTTSPLVENGEFCRIGERLSPWPAFVICASDKIIAQRGEALARLLDQTNQLCQQLTENPVNTINRISARYELSVETTTAWFKTMDWSTQWAIDHNEFVLAVKYLQKLNLLNEPLNQHDPTVLWERLYDSRLSLPRK